MSCIENDKVMENKVEAYQEQISSLSEKALESHFAEVFGVSPIGYFILSTNAENTDKWIEALIDQYCCELYKDLDFERSV